MGKLTMKIKTSFVSAGLGLALALATPALSETAKKPAEPPKALSAAQLGAGVVAYSRPLFEKVKGKAPRDVAFTVSIRPVDASAIASGGNRHVRQITSAMRAGFCREDVASGILKGGKAITVRMTSGEAFARDIKIKGGC